MEFKKYSKEVFSAALPLIFKGLIMFIPTVIIGFLSDTGVLAAHIIVMSVINALNIPSFIISTGLLKTLSGLVMTRSTE